MNESRELKEFEMSKSPNFIITETEPMPLLRDFATFTQYLRAHHIVLTRVNEFISGRDLYELNQEMTHPLPDTTPRTDQTLYPLLHLFYHLVLAGKLFQKVPEKGGRFVLKTTGRLQLYDELKLTEKYFFLLETFWVDADWEKLQAGYFERSPLYTVPKVLEYLSKQQPGEKIQLKGEKAFDIAEMFLDWEYFLHYFFFFGFWEVTYEDLSAQHWPKRYFRAESITPSAFGVAIARVLKDTRNLFYWNLPTRREAGEWKAIPGSPLPDENLFELFEEELKLKRPKAVIRAGKEKPGDLFFLPFVPLFAEGELQKTLPREGIKFVDGTYVFKVGLAKNLWRRIEISANHTLLDLHRAIQEAYNFDDDHLYSFFMDGKPWSHEGFRSPFEDEGPYVDEARIGELGLFVGQNILYLFDYGDEWRFRVELEKIRTEGSKPRKPKIMEKKGESPEQYRYYEE
ncbi:MAG: plasmid pRiA4b ORF-3 family protein [Candidatus Thermoplasmatota archaeon]|nr:plasmid pRiA4b ORF-3 family protein [Candidatus Thermoplasmatota archaeon]